MSFLSQPGFVGFKTQAAKGTYADPGAVAPNQGVFVRTRTGSMGTNRALIVPEAEIGGNRDIPDAQLGTASFTGSYEMYLRMESAAFFLKNLLGGNADSGTALTGYLHTITGADTSMPWVSVEEQEASGFLNLKYTDVKLNDFHMDCAADGYLMATCSMIGLTQVIDATPTILSAQRWDTSGLLIGPMISITYNGVTLPAKSFTLDIKNNVENNDFRLGSYFLADAVEKRREIMMGCVIRPQDNLLWKQAVWGTQAATGVAGTKTSQQAVITITGYDDIPGANAGTKYTMTFTVPNAVIEPYNFDPKHDDVVENTLNIRTLRPNPAVSPMTVAIRNSYSTVP